MTLRGDVMNFSTIAVLAACDSVIAESRRAKVQRNAQILLVQLRQLPVFLLVHECLRRPGVHLNISVTTVTSVTPVALVATATSSIGTGSKAARLPQPSSPAPSDSRAPIRVPAWP